MNCQRCGREITKENSFTHQSRLLCEDCFMEVGLHPRECDPWETYSATNTPGGTGLKSKLELTDQQKKVMELLMQKRKIPRDGLMKDMNLSEAEIDSITTPLFRAELAKLINESGTFYLVPLPYLPNDK